MKVYIQFRQHASSISLQLWVTVTGDLTSPYKVLPHMSAASYLCFIMANLPQLLGDVLVETQQTIWFIHDGHPAHFTCHVKQFLNSITKTERFCDLISFLLTYTYTAN
jgi:hypothetical protein